MIDGHGDDLYRYGDSIKHNFSSNILQGIDYNGLTEHLREHLGVMSNYPEPAPYSIEHLLAERLDISEDCIMVTNGAAEAIHIIARAYDGSHSTVLQPTFAEYADACQISNHHVKSIETLDNIATDTDMVWLCNPNNPTGTIHDAAILHTLLESKPRTTFVIDQAYHRYTDKRTLSASDVIEHRNLLLLYSMTKDYAVPGLRMGYVVANSGIIAHLRRFRIPWSVNAIAIEAAKYLLTTYEKYVDINNLLIEVSHVSSAFRAMGISVVPSDTNFILCQLPKGSAADLKEYLADKHKILIRDASNFHGLTSRHFRIAVQTHEENDLLINAILQWMQS